jgi:hypothetical protein
VIAGPTRPGGAQRPARPRRSDAVVIATGPRARDHPDRPDLTRTASLPAHALHERAPVVDVSRVLIVVMTEQGAVLDGRRPALGVRIEVVELEPRPGAASLPLRRSIRAPFLVALGHAALDLRWQVVRIEPGGLTSRFAIRRPARRLRPLRLALTRPLRLALTQPLRLALTRPSRPPLTRRRRLRKLALAGLLDHRLQSQLDHRGQIAVRHLVPQQVARMIELALRLLTQRDLQEVPLRRQHLHRLPATSAISGARTISARTTT